MFTNIDSIEPYSLQYSICTVVNNLAEYAEMKYSFAENGFQNNCEYLIADNSRGNQYDAYQAIRKFFQVAKGRYLIICHQDIIIKDPKSILDKAISELNQLDNNWAIAGNAGGKHFRGVVKNIINPDLSVSTYPKLPVKVFSVDENFLVIDAQKCMAISNDLRGFHFYGTDLCLIADILGYNSYVINFMLHHKSPGNFDEKFYQSKSAFKKKYSRALRQRFIESTCTRMYISGSLFKNWLLNTKAVFFLVKTYHKFMN